MEEEMPTTSDELGATSGRGGGGCEGNARMLPSRFYRTSFAAAAAAAAVFTNSSSTKPSLCWMFSLDVVSCSLSRIKHYWGGCG